MQAYDAIVLVGGAGSRLGGIDKAALPLAGAALVSGSFTAIDGAQQIVVVGRTSAPVPPRAVVVQENPPGGGPAAAVVAGLAALADPAPWIVILACDLPGASSALPRVLAAASGDGAVAIDADGRRQWVLGAYAAGPLIAAAAATAVPNGRSMRALVGDLSLVDVPVGDDWRDVDTWEDHTAWTNRLKRGSDR
ncbi:molybdenum cofactor guanylyltransferase [Calidifontibacter terrae]